MNPKIKKILKILAAVVIIAAVVALCVYMIPAVLSLSQPENQQKFEEFVESLGFLGILLMLFIQILQIIVAVIPGEPIELIMGLMYGTFGGLFLSLAGVLAGSAIVYFCVRKFGISFAKKYVDIEKFEKLKFLNNPSKRDSLVFILFFIPGTPKDVLTYFVPFTKMPPLRFLATATIARIPSIITSTAVGSSVSEGEFLKSIIIFAVTGILGIVGIIINNRITSSQNKHDNKSTKGITVTNEKNNRD